MASSQVAPPQLTRERLLPVRTPLVVSPQHPLATHGAPIPTAVLAEHIQLVHADPSDLSRPGGFGLLSPRVWRLSHLGAKLAFLRAGLGFGLMPLHMIEADLASGALVPIRGESAPPEGYVIAMSAVYRTDSPPGRPGVGSSTDSNRKTHGGWTKKRPYRRPRSPSDLRAVRLPLSDRRPVRCLQ